MVQLVTSNQYRCKYFKIEELVHPDLLKEIPENILWTIFDSKLLKVADTIREEYGTITINTSIIHNAGLRPMNSDVGAKYSAHKFGRALDLHIVYIDKNILDNKARIIEYNKIREYLINKDFIIDNNINFEDNVSWLHIDTYNRVNKLFQG